jgi:hypothetical protein
MLLDPWHSVSRSPKVAWRNVGADASVHAGGRYLEHPLQREGLKRLLHTNSREVGWPAHRIIEDLDTFWSR